MREADKDKGNSIAILQGKPEEFKGMVRRSKKL